METVPIRRIGFHGRADLRSYEEGGGIFVKRDAEFTYTFENFFHPFVGELIKKLNDGTLSEMLDPAFLGALDESTLSARTQPNSFFKLFTEFIKPKDDPNDRLVFVEGFPKEIDFSVGGPYSNYNWELFFHIPLAVAVHLSKNQRFSEAQRWFHYIFNPTSGDQSVDAPNRFWNCLPFRKSGRGKSLEEIVRILSTSRMNLSSDDQKLQDDILNGYSAILNKPFEPHRVARTRHLAYQYNVVMKYLDNLIAWGDSLFQQDTIESINEATQIYVSAANILGARPQQVPPLGTLKAKTFAQLRKQGLGPIGDALVDLESQFPLNLSSPETRTGSSTVDASPLFGIGRALYFCIPKNDKMLSYWDTVGDRLFKIRHCMDIAGVVRPLALFEPPIDPGMLVRAATVGIDIGSIVSGLNQPIGPIRSLFMIQKAIELCGEVRNLGSALLSALEKGDAEHLATIRQRHDIQIQQMAQEVRFLQWKQSQENTTSLLTSRKTALERLNYYKRLLNIPDDPNAPDDLPIDHSTNPDATPILTEDNFDEAYSGLVGKYDKQLTRYDLPQYAPVGGDLPLQQSGSMGAGKLYLSSNELQEITEGDQAKTFQNLARINDAIVASLYYIPLFNIKMAYWGLGGDATIGGGQFLGNAGQVVSNLLRGWADDHSYAGTVAAKTGTYGRRADEWLLQYNLAAHELMQVGRQILASLIAEQVAHHEYKSVKQQVANAQEVDQFIHNKFTNEDLYHWMQGESSRLYYEYYRFAFDTARKAENSMKQELMRPELDTQDFVKFNYWDGGRKGLLSGEALHLDVKRMEMVYHENNKRELELTKHVSLRQLNPVALLALKTTGSCTITIPEWLYDLDCPGHYMRRIKSVAVSIPAVVGPYTSVNCTVSLLRSSLRKSPIAGDDYARQGSEDDRFVDYIGAVHSMVTSSGQNDSGLFETNLRDDRFLPFEGAGAESTWKLDLPKDYRAFDYASIADVILHIRYTSRQGVDPTKVRSSLATLFAEVSQSSFALLFNLRYDFPSEWARFVSGNEDFSAVIRTDHFPYLSKGRTISIDGLELYDGFDVSNHHSVESHEQATADLADSAKSAFTLATGPSKVLTRQTKDVFLVVRYSIGA